MNRSGRSLRFVVALTLGAVGVTGVVIVAEEPPPLPELPQVVPHKGPCPQVPIPGIESKVYASDLINEEAINPQPSNGVILVTAAQGLPAEKPTCVEVVWRLWYTGPRSPLVIRRPSLTEAFREANETDLCFHSTGKSEKTYAYSVTNPVNMFRFARLDSPPNTFVRVPAAGYTGGKLCVPLADIRAKFRKARPEEFAAGNEPLYAKLYFNPADRGELLGMDAWTGSVESLLGGVVMPQRQP